MKNRHSIPSLAAALVIAAVLIAAAPAEAQRHGGRQIGPNCVGGIGDLLDQIEQVTLTEYEESNLIFLREEEKLARDVYLTLSERWQLPIFSNIARAEQTHMDRVGDLIELYGMEDPVTDDAVGIFSDAALGDLYAEFVANGEISLVDALLVGAEIEDMDLADLYELLENTDNDHIKLIAHNLAKGSRNHLRAFVRALAAQDAVYSPQYLDPDTYDAILAAEMERRTVYNAGGEPVPTCGGGWLGSNGRNQQGRNGQGRSGSRSGSRRRRGIG